ncbi:MAG: class I SAM-dependent methyltransferase [Deltaproteobacteria bacterium]|nr:class I SAM-dependent methyltransferase [Candidatus Zymogenaceae bacterium]
MKEKDIRPDDLFKEYLELAVKDSTDFFSDDDFVHVTCPACGGKERAGEFEKHAFTYVHCRECRTLYVSPRPSRSPLMRYYGSAPSSLFWTKFYRNMWDARREKIFVPRAKMVHDMCSEYAGDCSNVYDIGGGHGIMCDEMRKLSPHASFVVIEPSHGLAEMARENGLFVVEKFMEDVVPQDMPNRADGYAVAMCFEILEHLFDPLTFLRAVRAVLSSGDIFVVTFLNNLGFDLSLLWEESDSIHPPQHVTIFNIESLPLLLERAGFTVLSMTTPGKLDVELVNKKKEKVKDPFLRYMMRTLDEAAMGELQRFLSSNLLSSFSMCMAQVA